MKRALDVLHAKKIVFGDFRLPNIMIEDSSGRALLIDFDWAAEDGVGRYPASMNLEEAGMGWERTVERYGVMEAKHDLHLLRLLEERCE